MTINENFTQLLHEFHQKLKTLEMRVRQEEPYEEIDSVGDDVDVLFARIMRFPLVTKADRAAAIKFAVNSLRDFTDGGKDIECYLDLIERASSTPNDAAGFDQI